MSGVDEQLNGLEGFSTPTFEVYLGWIRHVISFMHDSNLSSDVDYTILEIEGFAEMSGLFLSKRWTEIVARAVKRKYSEVEVLMESV